MSRRRAPHRSIPLAAALLVAFVCGPTPAGAAAPEPEWGAEAQRVTDALVDPAATSPQESADAYRLEQSAEQTATMSALTAPSPWSLSGSGWGHGVGMSQYGAWQMAVDGYTAPQILAHYYTGTTYDLVPDTQVISVNLLNNVASILTIKVFADQFHVACTISHHTFGPFTYRSHAHTNNCRIGFAHRLHHRVVLFGVIFQRHVP